MIKKLKKIIKEIKEETNRKKKRKLHIFKIIIVKISIIMCIINFVIIMMDFNILNIVESRRVFAHFHILSQGVI